MRCGLVGNGKNEIQQKNRETVRERVVTYVKEQDRIQAKISDYLKKGPKTVPAIAESTGISSSTILWHVIAMKKYGQVVESGQEGDYPTYQLIME